MAQSKRLPWRPYSFPLSQGHTLLTNDVSYFGPGSSSWRFQAASSEVSRANAAQDFLPTFRNDPDLHFDAEQLSQGHTPGWAPQETLVMARARGHTQPASALGQLSIPGR